MLKDKESSGQESEEVKQRKGGKDVQGQKETEKEKGVRERWGEERQTEGGRECGREHR